MKYEKDLIKAVEEMNVKFGLKPPIPTDTSIEAMEAEVRENIDLAKTSDTFAEGTLKVFKKLKLTLPGQEKVEEPEEDIRGAGELLLEKELEVVDVEVVESEVVEEKIETAKTELLLEEEEKIEVEDLQEEDNSLEEEEPTLPAEPEAEVIKEKETSEKSLPPASTGTPMPKVKPPAPISIPLVGIDGEIREDVLREFEKKVDAIADKFRDDLNRFLRKLLRVPSSAKPKRAEGISAFIIKNLKDGTWEGKPNSEIARIVRKTIAGAKTKVASIRQFKGKIKRGQL